MVAAERNDQSKTLSRAYPLIGFIECNHSSIQIVDEELPPPAKGEVQLRQTAIGFNFIDIYQRSGVYPLEFNGTWS